MRILLIGGNGFIGSPLARELRASGHELAILHRNAQPADSGDATIVGDQNRLLECREKIGRFGPDAIIDLILSSEGQAQQLIETARGLVGRLVVLSSMDVYRAWGVMQQVEPGPLEPLPVTEDSAVRTVRQAYPRETITAIRSTFTWLDEHYDKIAVEQTVMSSPGCVGNGFATAHDLWSRRPAAPGFPTVEAHRRRKEHSHSRRGSCRLALAARIRGQRCPCDRARRDI